MRHPKVWLLDSYSYMATLFVPRRSAQLFVFSLLILLLQKKVFVISNNIAKNQHTIFFTLVYVENDMQNPFVILQQSTLCRKCDVTDPTKNKLFVSVEKEELHDSTDMQLLLETCLCIDSLLESQHRAKVVQCTLHQRRWLILDLTTSCLRPTWCIVCNLSSPVTGYWMHCPLLHRLPSIQPWYIFG